MVSEGASIHLTGAWQIFI